MRPRRNLKRKVQSLFDDPVDDQTITQRLPEIREVDQEINVVVQETDAIVLAPENHHQFAETVQHQEAVTKDPRLVEIDRCREVVTNAHLLEEKRQEEEIKDQADEIAQSQETEEDDHQLVVNEAVPKSHHHHVEIVQFQRVTTKSRR